MASTVSDGTTTITPYFVKGYQAVQAGRNIFHDVIGKTSQDVTLFQPKLRSGTLSFYFKTSPEADACRTYLLALQHMPDLAELYLDAYLDLAGFSRSQVTDWLPVIAGARLAENIGAEAEKLIVLSRR